MKAVFLDFDTVSAGDIDTASLDAALPDMHYFGTSDPAQVTERIADAEVLLINKIRVDAAVIAAAPKLRLVCAAATGTDNIDMDAAGARNIAVCNIRDYCTASVVQHVFALLLALNHHLDGYGKLLAAGEWRQHPQFCMLNYPILELDGLKLGIVGYGTLGRATARAAGAFGMEVLVARSLGGSQAGDERLPLDDVLAQSDVISLHCPLNAATRHMIDEAALARMKPSAFLINTARGALVDASALADALRAGRLAGAGIDVLEQEPPVDGNPLLADDIPNLIVTPHVAWAARAARQRAVDEMALNARAFLAGEQRNRVI
ncbi:MAG: NAD(P)-dependent oxidoreductase [Pseudomonadota bacterium]